MAISLTREEAQYRAWVLAANGLDEETAGFTYSDVGELIDEAVRATCDQVVANGDYTRLQTTFTGVALSGGQAVLNDAVMPETIRDSRGGQVICSSKTYPLSYVNFADLKYPQPGGSQLGFYNVQGGNGSGGVLYASDGTGAALTGTLTITCCAYQTFSTLSPQLEDEFIVMLAQMVKSKKMAGPITNG